MPRVKYATSSHKRRKRVLKRVKGQVGPRSKAWKIAKEALRRARVDNYIGRKDRKREFRALWILRINNACRAEGLTYSKFIAGLKKANVIIDRKMMADVAYSDNGAFKALVAAAKQ